MLNPRPRDETAALRVHQVLWVIRVACRTEVLPEAPLNLGPAGRVWTDASPWGHDSLPLLGAFEDFRQRLATPVHDAGSLQVPLTHKTWYTPLSLPRLNIDPDLLK